ncbi:phosphoglycerate mutase-like protein [Colletotrichum zoysiae]|uniref:Phosphoglycerate mutase-like protein n=1 Tax=Colletotrichum zoysiae TaxID=1216348 RepID=A0AAD9HCM1_9PEZI|nr:phosphoglycerate mutase-like protein [Colletotrichum zoysiae]
MGLLSFVLIASALLPATSAQSSNPSVWASVAMIMHGERTPLRSELQNVLTPQGAQQLYAQGDAFRLRYLTSEKLLINSSVSRITSRFPIQGMARNVLEHEQLAILSAPDSHIVAGANAFMQGLYPPITMAFAADTGGPSISYSTLTGNSTQYPLDGYQYPVIETLGSSDERSVAIRGNVECPQWNISTTTAMQLDPDMKKLYETSLPQYQSLFSTPPLNDGVVTPSSASFWDAYNIQQYVSYRYSHDQAVYDEMKDGYARQSEFLMMYARLQQLNMTSNQAVSGLQKGDMIRTIAGRSLAQKVVDALWANSTPAGPSKKMTLMFSSHEPFLSFFSLAQLQQGNPTLLNPFWNIPQNGAAMVFELIGDKPDTTGDDVSAYPTEENLYVRFLYRENADPKTPFKEYALFGLADTETRVPYGRFKQEMLKFGVDASAWCKICGSVQSFCHLRTEQPTVGGAICSAVQKPFVAGIIGAVIVLAVLGLAAVAAIRVGGFRIKRPGTEPRPRRESQIPILFRGLRAAEKTASDPDMSVSRRGSHHERHGSWELRDGPDVTSGKPELGVGKSMWSFSNRSVGSLSTILGSPPIGPKEHV